MSSTANKRLALRASSEEIRRQTAEVSELRDICELLNAVPGVLMLLNEHRQVVYGNHALASLLNVPTIDAVYGRRPGELLDCEHSCETPEGCGTSPACKGCGAAKAIEECERGAASVQECRIIQHGTGRALDLRVSSTPYHINGRTYRLIAFTDISHELRRRTLERLFFHDLLNIVGALQGYASLLSVCGDQDRKEMSRTVVRLSNILAEEVQAQRDLSAAENGELEVRWDWVEPAAVLRDVYETFAYGDLARDRVLRVEYGGAGSGLLSDRRILIRVIGNMVRNALEASRPGETVTMRWEAIPSSIQFSVHNPGVIDPGIQVHIFQRSFTTKGPGRGLGTYSMKLLSERYLRGRVHFESSPDEGTTFVARYPAAAAAKA